MRRSPMMGSYGLPVPGRSSGTRPRKKVRFTRMTAAARKEAAKNKAKLKKLEERFRKLKILNKDQKIPAKPKPKQTKKGVDKDLHDDARRRNTSIWRG